MEELFKYIGYIVTLVTVYNWFTKPSREKLGFFIFFTLLGLSFILGAIIFSNYEKYSSSDNKEKIIEITNDQVVGKVIELIKFDEIIKLDDLDLVDFNWSKKPMENVYYENSYDTMHIFDVNISHFEILITTYDQREFLELAIMKDSGFNILPYGVDIGVNRNDINIRIPEINFEDYNEIIARTHTGSSYVKFSYDESEKISIIKYENTFN